MTTQTEQPQLDMQKVEAFGGRALGLLNDAALVAMLSIGHKTRLLDTLATLPPSTSQQIADAANLNERYVREWLGAVVTARIVEYNPVDKTYWFPREHAAMLTREAGPNNMANWAQAIVELTKATEASVTECFRTGGGVPYSAFPGFQKLMADLSGMVFDGVLVSNVLPHVPGVVQQLEQGIEVADVGCGSGHAINLMAKAFPNSRFAGYDFSPDGIAAARSEAAAWGLRNAAFQVQDAAALNVRDRFDFITTFDSIHDQAYPGKVLKNIANALKPGGTYLMVDEGTSSYLEENIDHPMGTLLYSVSVLHCMTVSLAQGGEGLGTMWGEQLARKMLADAGFTVQEVKRVEGDIENAYYITTKAR
ncbi:MAG: class I SAM-dependent methyltransferase [Chloroflexi bacterium]|nr:class I SAM-dependent methyltransferase [Chloroflexota bacterium]